MEASTPPQPRQPGNNAEQIAGAHSQPAPLAPASGSTGPQTTPTPPAAPRGHRRSSPTSFSRCPAAWTVAAYGLLFAYLGAISAYLLLFGLWRSGPEVRGFVFSWLLAEAVFFGAVVPAAQLLEVRGGGLERPTMQCFPPRMAFLSIPCCLPATRLRRLSAPSASCLHSRATSRGHACWAAAAAQRRSSRRCIATSWARPGGPRSLAASTTLSSSRQWRLRRR